MIAFIHSNENHKHIFGTVWWNLTGYLQNEVKGFTWCGIHRSLNEWVFGGFLGLLCMHQVIQNKLRIKLIFYFWPFE